MPHPIDDSLSRFERIEKVLETIVQLQHLQASNLASLLAMHQSQAARAERIDRLVTKVDDLVGAVRSLIHRTPPQILQSAPRAA